MLAIISAVIVVFSSLLLYLYLGFLAHRLCRDSFSLLQSFQKELLNEESIENREYTDNERINKMDSLLD